MTPEQMEAYAQTEKQAWERDFRTYLNAARDKIDIALRPGRRRMPALSREEFKALRCFMLKFDDGNSP